MTCQTFTILGIPKAQGRPKFYRRGTFVGAYDPSSSREYKNNVAAQICSQQPYLFGRDKALILRLVFWLPRPKGHFGKKGLKPSAPADHTTKPDLDNLIKAIKDALKGLVWVDDSQVCRLVADKKYGAEPKVEIEVRTA